MNIHELLDDKHPYASFHDSVIHELNLDVLERTAKFKMELIVTNVENTSKTETARGELAFYNFSFFIIEPKDECIENSFSNSLWVSDNGPITEEHPTYVTEQLKHIQGTTLSQYFFIQEWYSHIYVAASKVDFRWT